MAGVGSWYSASSPKPRSDSAQSGHPPLGRRGAGSARSGAGVWEARGGGAGPEDAGGPHFRSRPGHPSPAVQHRGPRRAARAREPEAAARPTQAARYLLREASGPVPRGRLGPWLVSSRSASPAVWRGLSVSGGAGGGSSSSSSYLGARGGDSRPGAASRPERTPAALPPRSAPPAPPAPPAAAAGRSLRKCIPRRVSRSPRPGGRKRPEARGPDKGAGPGGERPAAAEGVAPRPGPRGASVSGAEGRGVGCAPRAPALPLDSAFPVLRPEAARLSDLQGPVPAPSVPGTWTWSPNL